MIPPNKCIFDPHDETIQDLRDFLLAYCACFVALQTFLM